MNAVELDDYIARGHTAMRVTAAGAPATTKSTVTFSIDEDFAGPDETTVHASITITAAAWARLKSAIDG